MDHAEQHLVVLVVLGGGDLLRPICRWAESRVRHSQWIENILCAVCVERLAAHALDQRGQHDEIDVTVDEARLRRRHGGGTEGHAVPSVAALPRLIEIEIGGKAGIVGEQVAHGDVIFTILTKFWNVLHNWIVEADFPFFDQLHNRCRRSHDLGQRCDIENCLDRHGRAGWFERAVAEGFAEDYLAVVPDQQNRAWDFVVLNRGLNDGIENGEGLRLILLGEGERAQQRRQEAENESGRIGSVDVNEMNLHQR